MIRLNHWKSLSSAKQTLVLLFSNSKVVIVEPLGTITRDLPFLEDDIRSEIESLMDEATDYLDFSHLLAEKAKDSRSPTSLVFLALRHALNLDNHAVLEVIKDTHSKMPIVLPFFIPAENESYVLLVQAVDQAIDSKPNYAVVFYLLIKLYNASEVGSREETRVQKMIEDLLDQNDLLKAHSADYLLLVGQRLRYEGNPEEAFESYSRALEIARQSDNRWLESVLLLGMSEVTGQYTTDPNSYIKAREYLKKSKTISESLNNQSGIASVLQNISVFSGGRGEISEAIECQLEVIRIRESLGEVDGSDAWNLSNQYAIAGDGLSALEWARILEEQWTSGPTHLSYSNIALARAYIALDKLEDAQQHLDTAKKQALKGGLELTLGMWYYVNGFLERKLGDLESAMETLQQALDINERANRQVRLRMCLYELAVTELAMYSPTKENRDNKNSGPWMTRLEELVQIHDLPGHYARYLLLKAELRMKQGKHSESEKILEEVLDVTDSPLTRYIHQNAIETHENWIADGLLPPSTSRRRNP
jgi:tetratricopeptide (TPR) repeat protein